MEYQNWQYSCGMSPVSQVHYKSLPQITSGSMENQVFNQTPRRNRFHVDELHQQEEEEAEENEESNYEL